MEGGWAPCGGAGARLLAGDCCRWDEVAAVEADEVVCEEFILVDDCVSSTWIYVCCRGVEGREWS